MREVGTTAALVVAAGGGVAAIAPGAALEVVLGVAAPLAVGIGSLVLMDRTYKRSPERLTRLLVRAFLAKLVIFGLYMALTVSLLSLDPVWFAGSFTVSFVALHLAEALHLQRLYTG